MDRRLDLYRREKRIKTRSGRPLSAFRLWQVFFALFAIWSSIAAVAWLVGFDFATESSYRKLKVCGFARFIFPETIGYGMPCVAWNLLPFYLMPGFALVLAIRQTLLPR